VPVDAPPVLLDTQVVLWLLAGGDQLSPRARRLIDDERRELVVSAVSLWEVAIKRSLGKLRAPRDLARRLLATGQVRLLPIAPAHAEAVADLPWHHRDPFDRLLVVQAQLERLLLVSADAELRRYGLDVTW
jgi:PIN domain nuclease of toxin-antitoxin system